MQSAFCNGETDGGLTGQKADAHDRAGAGKMRLSSPWVSGLSSRLDYGGPKGS
jgi:hypothetical protein